MGLYEKTHRYSKNYYQFFDALKTKYCKIRGNCNLLTKVKFLELKWSSPLRYRGSHPEVFLVKGVLKICSKFTGEHRYRSVITLLHGCSPVNLLHIFRTPFFKNTFGWLLLKNAIDFSSRFIQNSFCFHNVLPFSSFVQIL